MKNTYYKAMNELDTTYITTDSLREAKKVAKATAKKNKEYVWVIDVLNFAEVVVYNDKGEEW